MAATLAQRIALLALARFDALPARCKPRVDAAGKREWTPMSAVVLRTVGNEDGDENETETRTGNGSGDGNGDGEEEVLKCVALATGTKCLPASAVGRCQGMVLHDSHAEILALRGLNRFLLGEVMSLLEREGGGRESPYLELNPTAVDGGGGGGDGGGCCCCCRGEQPHLLFRLRASVSIYLFSSTAPCGDASMELLIVSKSPEEAVPWSEEAMENDLGSGMPLGRGHFSLLGAVRRKPSRGDAEATMSKSCTDKIALKQFVGLLAFPVDLFVQRTNEAYLKGVVLYGEQFDEGGYERAFAEKGRLHRIGSAVTGHYFDLLLLPDECPRFEFDKQQGTKATNLSALWIAGSGGVGDVQETLINGVKQGFKQFDDGAGKASVVSRKSMLEQAFKIQQLLHKRDRGIADCEHHRDLSLHNYSDLKQSYVRNGHREIKNAFIKGIGGWVSNASEDDFSIKSTS